MPSAAHDAFVAGLPPGGATQEVSLSSEQLADLRNGEEATLVAAFPGAEMQATDAAGVPALWVSVGEERAPRTIFYLHGGGYMYLRVRNFVPLMVEVAKEANACFMAVEYRRAPENPYPAALEDAVTAYRWLLEQDTDPCSIAFVGDSAGGGLVLATLLAARDRGLPMPAAAACFSPWTDLKVTGDSAYSAKDPVVSGPALRRLAHDYLAGASPEEPYASPLYGDLAGLPPLHIQVGTRESLLDDSRRFAGRARQAGCDVTLIEYQDVVHNWISHAYMPESQTAFAAVGEFLKTRIPHPAPEVPSAD